MHWTPSESEFGHLAYLLTARVKCPLAFFVTERFLILTSEFVNNANNTTLSAEVTRDEKFNTWMSKNSHLEFISTPRRAQMPTTQIVTVPCTIDEKTLEYTEIEHVLSTFVSARSFKREKQRRFNMSSRSGRDRKAGRQRAHVLYSRALRQRATILCGSCGTEWFEKELATLCCSETQTAETDIFIMTMLEIYNTREHWGKTYFSAVRHLGDSGSPVAFCGYIDENEGNIKETPEGNFEHAYGKISSSQRCEVCTIIRDAYEDRAGEFVVELTARSTKDGVICSEWNKHLRDDQSASAVSLCDFIEGSEPSRALPIDFESKDDERVTQITECEVCPDIKEQRRGQEKMKNPSWVAEQMGKLRRKQEWHREYGKGEGTMRVKDLIQLLSEQDQESAVLIHAGYSGCPCCSDSLYKGHLDIEPQKGWNELPDTGGSFTKKFHPGGIPTPVVMVS